MSKTRKLLAIGHSYVVALNRRLVHEISLLGQGEWEATTVSPSSIHRDLRLLHIETDPNELCQLEAVSVYLSRYPHLMVYSWQLKEILQQGWDLVDCWQEPYVLVGAQIASWMPDKTPLVYKTAQNLSKKYPPPFNWIENYAMRRAAGWICCGHTVADALKDRPGYSLPMQVIPHGVDINKFYPCVDARQKALHRLAWEHDNSPIIGYLGRLVPEKGLDLLMHILNNLKIPWRALFIGIGPMEAPLREWAKRYPERVRICTDVKHNEVPQYLNAMDVLCAPSQSISNWREQFGRMLVEAFACGVPVIGSDSGEIPYVIQDAGVIVGEKDEQGWVQALSDLLDSSSRRQELALKGLERAKVFTWSVVAKQHLEFFTKILDS